ncbi:MAG: hypothetical protein ACR5KW_00795 [Wolbachia sp.]
MLIRFKSNRKTALYSMLTYLSLDAVSYLFWGIFPGGYHTFLES